MAQLAHLPDLCLLFTFDQVPLRDLLRHIPLVCKRWSHLAPSALSRRRELRINIAGRSIANSGEVIKIFPSEPLLNYLLPFSVRPISAKHFQQVKAQFRQVRSLCMRMFYIRYKETSPPFRGFLTHFGPGLVKLELSHVLTFQLKPALFELLSERNLPQLRNFTFDMSDSCFDPVPAHFAFPIVRQLRKCRFDIDGISLEDLHQAVLQYVEQANEHIECELGSMSPREVSSLLEVNSIISKRITKIDYLHNASDIDTIRQLCAHFPCLTEITYYVHNRNFGLSEFFGCLNQLAQLKSLRLNFTPAALTNYRFTGQLTSVRHLQLISPFESHLQLFESGFHLGATFPHLESLVIKIFPRFCSLCRVVDHSSSRARNCLQQLFDALMNHHKPTTLKHVIVKQLICDKNPVEWRRVSSGDDK